MPHYTDLIVWGGMTADAATYGIRQVDIQGSIGLIGAENYLPYNRPPLSKQLWKGKALDRIWRGTGGTPRRLPFGGDHIIYYRMLDDCQRLRALADQGQHFVVIGGGFMGSEMAAPGPFTAANLKGRLRV